MIIYAFIFEKKALLKILLDFSCIFNHWLMNTEPTSGIHTIEYYTFTLTFWEPQNCVLDSLKHLYFRFRKVVIEIRTAVSKDINPACFTILKN